MFVIFSKKCKYRKIHNTGYGVRGVCSYNNQNTLTRFMEQCNEYNCPLYGEQESESEK